MYVLRAVMGAILLAGLSATAGCEHPTGEEAVVVGAVEVGAVEVTTPSHTLAHREELQLAVTVRDTSGAVLQEHPVVWESLDTTRATVSQTGLVRGRRSGIVWITASAGGKKGGVSLQVYEAKLVLAPDSLVFSNTEPQRLFARVFDGEKQLLGETAEFTVQDSAVVHLESCGGGCTGSSRGTTRIVSPRNPGVTRIIASWRGAADTALVRVLP